MSVLYIGIAREEVGNIDSVKNNEISEQNNEGSDDETSQVEGLTEVEPDNKTPQMEDMAEVKSDDESSKVEGMNFELFSIGILKSSNIIS